MSPDPAADSRPAAPNPYTRRATQLGLISFCQTCTGALLLGLGSYLAATIFFLCAGALWFRTSYWLRCNQILFIVLICSKPQAGAKGYFAFPVDLPDDSSLSIPEAASVLFRLLEDGMIRSVHPHAYLPPGMCYAATALGTRTIGAWP